MLQSKYIHDHSTLQYILEQKNNGKLILDMYKIKITLKLFYAIEVDEEYALTMIDNSGSQRIMANMILDIFKIKITQL